MARVSTSKAIGGYLGAPPPPGLRPMHTPQCNVLEASTPLYGMPSASDLRPIQTPTLLHVR